jgi:hypothetical protein
LKREQIGEQEEESFPEKSGMDLHEKEGTKIKANTRIKLFHNMSI